MMREKYAVINEATTPWLYPGVNPPNEFVSPLNKVLMRDIHEIPPESSYEVPDIYLSEQEALDAGYVSPYKVARETMYPTKVVATITGNYSMDTQDYLSTLLGIRQAHGAAL